jgi:hypothetical protein
MAYISEIMDTDVSSVDAIRILHFFLPQQDSYELLDFIEYEMGEPGDNNFGQSQYRFSKKARSLRNI